MNPLYAPAECVQRIEEPMDTMIKAARDEDIANIEFNKRLMRKLIDVREEYTFFCGFIEDEYPELYEVLPEDAMRLLHIGLQRWKNYLGVHNSMAEKYDDAVYKEARSRAEG
jgi:hypothetical protein